MPRNMGPTDRAIRLILGLALVLLTALGLIFPATDWLRYTLLVVGLVFAGTAMIRFCPLYAILGIRT